MDAEQTVKESTGSRPAPEPRSTERRTTDLDTGDLPAGGAHAGDRRVSDDRGDDPRTYPGELRQGDHRVPAPLPSNVYRARRPAVAILLIIPAIGIGLLLLKALATAAFGPTFLIGGVIASSCALVALPLLVAGLYGLVTGAAHGADQHGFKVWARPPLAYLIVGLALLIASGLAVR